MERIIQYRQSTCFILQQRWEYRENGKSSGGRCCPGTEIEIRIKSVADVIWDDIIWCDWMALGSPTHLGTVSSTMKKFWEDNLLNWQKVDGKIGCAFSSQGGWGGGAELTCLSLLTIMINYGFLVLGVTDYSGLQFTAQYGATQAGEPREDKQKEACRRLGKRLAVFVDGRVEQHPLRGTYKRNP